jgi:hypothetical protein
MGGVSCSNGQKSGAFESIQDDLTERVSDAENPTQ